MQRAVRFASTAACLVALAGGIVEGARPVDTGVRRANGQIAFVRFSGRTSQIHLVASDGTREVQLTRGGAHRDPSWSHDGQKIAFSGGGSLFVSNADGTGVVRLTRGGSDADPSWSPDDSRIAFTRGRGRKQDIYAVTVADGRVARLTSAGAADQEAAWSPDGTMIAFASERRHHEDIYVVEVASGNETRLTDAAASDGRGRGPI